MRSPVKIVTDIVEQRIGAKISYPIRTGNEACDYVRAGMREFAKPEPGCEQMRGSLGHVPCGKGFVCEYHQAERLRELDENE